MVVWDLRDAEGERVSAEFTLASLAAWTQVPSPALQALAEQCRGHSGSRTARNPDLWVPACYQVLFPARLDVSTEPRAVRAHADATVVLYFSWSRDQGPWSGVALAEVAASDYATNKARADSAVQALLARQPTIARALESSDGVYVDQERRVVGINFRRAADYYQIAGLP